MKTDILIIITDCTTLYTFNCRLFYKALDLYFKLYNYYDILQCINYAFYIACLIRVSRMQYLRTSLTLTLKTIQ